MKSHLRFTFNGERCLELLKKATNETSTLSIESSINNFGSIIKGKKFYGKFYEDKSFKLEPTTTNRASLGLRLKGTIKDVNNGKYKCHIDVEGKIPQWNWLVLIVFVFIALVLGEIFFLIPLIVIALIIIFNSEQQIRKGIDSIIQTIENEYE
ncbi:hypothetical protein [Tenacibaculum finnmarkense]|uniref:hypothetical protein n=1 Tax=Tenacibaculum finnmarkense TaxID=2781243 RepID=UPI001EFB3851|nr:hypothetical protein [Tenacibaculum finnmarkense]MCG8804041.1 hypothetical protein [Tenacibaculum finnmarkense]